MIKDIEIVQYKCTFTPLTPIQIGDGNTLSPFEYVIKDNKYYRIDMSEVIDKMEDDKRKSLMKILEKNNNFFELRKFFSDNYQEKYGYLYKCDVDKNFTDKYMEKIGGYGKKNEESELPITEFIGFHKNKYVPGSTLKGAIRGAYLMDNFNEKDYYKLERNIRVRTKPFKFKGENRGEVKKVKQIESRILGLNSFEPKFDPFKNIKITDINFNSDLIEIKPLTRIATKKEGISRLELGTSETLSSVFSNNKELNFDFSIFIKNIYGDIADKIKNLAITTNKFTKEKENIIKETQEFYLDGGLFNSLNEKAEKIIESDKKFFEKAKLKKAVEICNKLKEYKDKLKENQALIRIGRGAGFNSTTFNLCNEKVEDVFTRVTVDEIPVGWALITCEEI